MNAVGLTNGEGQLVDVITVSDMKQLEMVDCYQLHFSCHKFLAVETCETKSAVAAQFSKQFQMTLDDIFENKKPFDKSFVYSDYTDVSNAPSRKSTHKRKRKCYTVTMEQSVGDILHIFGKHHIHQVFVIDSYVSSFLSPSYPPFFSFSSSLTVQDL